jgi:hypothetical protein
MYVKLQNQKNYGGSGMNLKCTEHDFRFYRCCLNRHMIHPSNVGCRLLMTVLLLWGLLILLLGIIVSIMPRFTAVVAYIGSARCTSLHGGIVRCPLPWSLLTTLLVDSAAADVETGCVEGIGHDSSDRAVPDTSDQGHAVN